MPSTRPKTEGGIRKMGDRIRNWPKPERPRERLLAEGAEKLTEADLLAIILRVGQGEV